MKWKLLTHLKLQVETILCVYCVIQILIQICLKQLSLITLWVKISLEHLTSPFPLHTYNFLEPIREGQNSVPQCFLFQNRGHSIPRVSPHSDKFHSDSTLRDRASSTSSRRSDSSRRSQEREIHHHQPPLPSSTSSSQATGPINHSKPGAAGISSGPSYGELSRRSTMESKYMDDVVKTKVIILSTCLFNGETS